MDALYPRDWTDVLEIIAATGSFLFVSILLLIQQPLSRNRSMCTMVSRKLYNMSQGQTVTAELARDPSQCPQKVFHKLFEGHHSLHAHSGSDSDSDSASKWEQLEELQKARSCGNFGTTETSELFLKVRQVVKKIIASSNFRIQVYHDALCCLEKNPMSGVVSPPLLGGTGVLPLTIVAPLPDLCRHLANCIVRAEHEIFLGTNFWIHSDASTLITNAIRELSKRAGEQGRKVVMKMIYDRGDPRQAWDNRLNVKEDQYVGGKVRLPAASEIPNVHLQVINFHRPIFGTFHAKFTVIDRRMALIQSSNIQDNDNLEMLSHIEGPIVDSFYDAALLSWGKPLEPPFPLLNSPAKDAPISSYGAEQNGASENGTDALPELTTKSPHYDQDLHHEARRVNGSIHPLQNETPTQAVSRHLNTTIQPDTTGDAPDSDQDPIMTPYMLLPDHEPFAMAVVNREPFGCEYSSSEQIPRSPSNPKQAPNHSSIHTPQNSAWISAINHAQRSILIQTPNMNAEPLMEPLINAARRGVIVTCYLCLGYNDAGELLPFQNGTNEMIANRLYNSLESDEEKSRLRVCYYVGKDQTRPIHNSFKKRSCHIKLMIVDQQIAIQGNGNLDTQSFFHSQEINVLIDSEMVCRAWTELINRNQNTAKYGAASAKDGCWHDPKTDEIPPGSMGPVPGRFSWAKGAIGRLCSPQTSANDGPDSVRHCIHSILAQSHNQPETYRPRDAMSRTYDQPIRDVVDYVYKYQLDEDDETIWESARTSLLDAMGCAIETAATSTTCRNFLGPMAKTTVPNGFKVPGTDHQVDAPKGAFDLGLLIRYLDHNDALGGAEWGHPSDNLGAIIPVMDWLSRASIAGEIVHRGPPLTMHTLLVALVKAYEIQGCYQMQNAFNAYGIDHVILVKLASVAVVSWILGLTEEQPMAAVSHVWMDGHPNRVYRSGANTVCRKGWAAGDSTRRAVQLAFMVSQGAAGSPGALSARPFGFLERTFGDSGFVFPRAFGAWTVRNVLFKTMPVEGHAMSAVEAAVLHAGLLRKKGVVDPARQIKNIYLRVTVAACMIIDKKGPLYNAADRDHCIQYVVALALLKGSPPVAVDYLDESPWAKSEELEALRGKIVVQADSGLQRDYLDLDKKSIGAGVTIYLENGAELPEILIKYPVGHARNPRTASAVQKKFFKNMSYMFSAAEISRILGAVQQPDILISDFIDLFIPSSKSKI
ncbi:unnamed protein product [Penicillium olsonii]|nr:unnamed protein product [Penicillium olsonii]